MLPAPAVDAAEPPRRLKGVAASEWARLYDLLAGKGIIHVGNLGVFEEYCFVLGELRRLENITKRLSAEIAIMHGYFKACANFRQQFRQLARDLKLTEYAGEKIGGEKEEGKLLKFLKAV